MSKKIVFSFLIFFLVAIFSKTADAQQPVAINHLALYVNDLQKSVIFYKEVMQLEEIPEPFKDGKHVWFRMGPHSQLHIIQGAVKVDEHDRNTHLAFSVKDLDAFMEHLDKTKAKYGSWQGDIKKTTVRPDGIKQVYMQDPDNYWIEVNDDRF